MSAGRPMAAGAGRARAGDGPPPTRRLLATAALPMLVATSVRLGSAPLTPEEAAWASGWGRSALALTHLGLGAESAVRLPGVLAVTVAAALVALAAGRRHRGMAGAVLAALAPALVAAGRTAGPEPLAALLGALATVLGRSGRPRRAALALAAMALAVAAVAVPALASSGSLPAAERPAAAALAAWGLLGGPSLPPWRLDLSPAVLLALVLAVLGAGRSAAALARLALLPLGAALLGLVAVRPGAAILAGAPLVPALLLAVAAGVARLPRAVPRPALAVVAVACGAVAAANLQVGRDLLDPARLVRWDEAARMLATLAEGDARLVAATPLPPSLRWYAPALAPAGVADDDDARMLVVAAGLSGGLQGSAARLGPGLERRGYRLAGELLLGPVEPRLQVLLAGAGLGPVESWYLRVRRYERPPLAAPDAGP